MKEVRTAGKKIAAGVDWDEADRKNIFRIFEVANSWRNSHLLPMRSARLSVNQAMRRTGIKGFTAARPKRMTSITSKMQRLTVKLDQLNDIAGCRAVIDDIAGVHSLVDFCRSGFPHSFVREYDYIGQPKADGYRCHHIIFKYTANSRDREIYNGRRIELQVRTRLQHSWATAVEAVGLFRNEALKASEGSPDWLRLFALMSAEFSETEGFDALPGATNIYERRKELRELDRRLNATGMLEDLKNTTNYLENYVHEPSRYFLITYDKGTHIVDVRPYFNAFESSTTFSQLEQRIASEHAQDDKKAVLVEVDKVEKLREAYPNYFGDVSLFILNLKNICAGREAIQYSMAPEVVAKPKFERPDPSWLFNRRRRWVEPRGR